MQGVGIYNSNVVCDLICICFGEFEENNKQINNRFFDFSLTDELTCPKNG
jgi:hypothetical protein